MARAMGLKGIGERAARHAKTYEDFGMPGHAVHAWREAARLYEMEGDSEAAEACHAIAELIDRS